MVLDECQHILEAAESIGTPLELLSDTEANALAERVRERYFRRYLDWNYFAVETRSSGRNASAWRWIDDYVARREACLLLYDRKQRVLRIPQGTPAVPIFAESYNSEIYLTDNAASYILIFNDHDVLIAAGDAMGWLTQRREQDEDEKRSKAQRET